MVEQVRKVRRYLVRRKTIARATGLSYWQTNKVLRMIQRDLTFTVSSVGAGTIGRPTELIALKAQTTRGQ